MFSHNLLSHGKQISAADGGSVATIGLYKAESPSCDSVVSFVVSESPSLMASSLAVTSSFACRSSLAAASSLAASSSFAASSSLAAFSSLAASSSLVASSSLEAFSSLVAILSISTTSLASELPLFSVTIASWASSFGSTGAVGVAGGKTDDGCCCCCCCCCLGFRFLAFSASQSSCDANGFSDESLPEGAFFFSGLEVRELPTAVPDEGGSLGLVDGAGAAS